MQVDGIGLSGAAYEVVHEKAACAFSIAGLRDPHSNLTGTDAVGFAEAALLKPVLGLALVVALNAHTYLEFVLGIVKIVQAHIVDRHMNGAHSVGACVVDIGNLAVILRATLGLKGSAAAECSIIVWPNGVNALITHIAHGHVTAEDKSHPSRDHILRMAVGHVVLRNPMCRQEYSLLLPIGCMSWVQHVIRALCASDGSMLGNQELFVNLECARWECVGPYSLLPRACQDPERRKRFYPYLQRRMVWAAQALLDGTAPG
mmetsp:Transcript_89454/g.208310  ORF Transcript_89454/g.208310 Transcript_89454/m.208310 type:complete len:260 (-) Transcript_89454:132-911(-)|eukprot:CAMPEP_0171087274 /NCGR_PEP_ID=MMETSP0766_2-20121228/20049_1 /TAXON_ID=439317 /ORGANISM="Gambierdiscus australes, Strain CAWD 149" /LENGTH=259 /DNA_ID=CAMNT_0011544967 /DNA_START=623 /DNA_END=1402 /DNA_ORIENTATION=-